MNIYSIYVNPERENEPFISIENSFSIMATLFTCFWALYHKMWRVALASLIINVFIALLQVKHLPGEIITLVNLLVMLVFGVFSTELQEYELEKKGYKLKDVILASSNVEAEIKFLTRQL